MGFSESLAREPTVSLSGAYWPLMRVQLVFGNVSWFIALMALVTDLWWCCLRLLGTSLFVPLYTVWPALTCGTRTLFCVSVMPGSLVEKDISLETAKAEGFCTLVAASTFLERHER